MNLRAKAVRGVRWTATRGVANVASRLIVMVVAAQTLSPLEIGLYAIINLVLGFARTFTGGGLVEGVIARRDVTPDQLSSLFWLNLLCGLAVSTVTGLAAPLVASFYQQPRLLEMLLLAALILVVAPLGQMSQTLLQRDMRFASLGLIDLVVSTLNCLFAITMLYAGFGIYSLIVAHLIAAIIRAFVLRIACRDLMPVRFRFNYAEIAPIANFGIFRIGHGLVNYFGGRLDQILIGALLGPKTLGYYALAWTLIVEPVRHISPVITSVAFPVFAKRQTEVAALKRGLQIVTKLLTTAVAPVLFGFAAIASTFVPLVLGDQWTPSVPLVELLAIVAIARMINSPVGPVVLAVGRADRPFYLSVSQSVVQAPFYAALLTIGGVIPATIFLCATSVIGVFLAYIYLLRPILGRIFVDYVKAFLPSVGLAASMAIAVKSLSMIEVGSTIGLLAAQIALGVIIYGGATLLFRRADLMQLVSLLSLRGE